MNPLVKLWRIVLEAYFLKGLFLGTAAGVEHEKILKALDCRFVVDIGANRGQFAMTAHKTLPGARIVSFEPLQEPARKFRRVFADNAMVLLHELAIGAENSEMTIHVSSADDSSSLLPIGGLQNRLFPGTEEKEQRQVQVRRLDAILKPEEIQPPALLKIDVQGFEGEVLKGCEALLDCFSLIYVECSFVELYTGQALAHQVISFLDGRGFALAGIHNLCYSREGAAIQGDFLFKRKSDPAQRGNH